MVVTKGDLPPSILTVKPNDIKELQQNDELLRSTRELTKDSQSEREQSIAKVKAALSDVDLLSRQLDRIKSLNDQVNRLQKEEIECKNAWIDTERIMLERVKPFTKEGINESILLKIENLEQRSKDIWQILYMNDNEGNDSSQTLKDFTDCVIELETLRNIQRKIVK